MLVPKNALIIGSGRGFVPILLAKALRDSDGSQLSFVDPSFDDNFWKDKASVLAWFEEFGVADYIKHFLMTTQEYVERYLQGNAPTIDFLFIDGDHTYKGAATDFKLLWPHLKKDAIVLAHDTVSRSRNPYWNGPRKVLLELASERPDLQQFDLPYGAGLTLLRSRGHVETALYIEELENDWEDKESIDFFSDTDKGKLRGG
ncbi:class I SAM-dependent methyltransferase [Xanthomonas euvesicatoria]|uniref:class I SAM-dependent methyltransferase n=1 Tax=Xanthomonas euvesicatoria TaxID=456327 RepID=UPI001C461C9D|nr:class I SAM-dependent methyltransferase [Xanthomonas euvesicatoria]MBV6896578.1 class I SAM-dependent methyltransferase [Xanthomonas campestris pv. ionidii]